MIVVRVTQVGKMIPSVLYKSLLPYCSSQQRTVDDLKKLSCKRMDNNNICKLSDLCNIYHVDDVNNQVTIMRGDITIDDEGIVKYFE